MVLKLIITSGENSRRYINKLAPSGLSLRTFETNTKDTKKKGTLRLIFPLKLKKECLMIAAESAHIFRAEVQLEISLVLPTLRNPAFSNPLMTHIDALVKTLKCK